MMEVYIDDMLVKSLHTTNHLTYLIEIFNILCAHNMKLNPNKCGFGVSIIKFLGFMVNQRGIETNQTRLKWCWK